MTKTIFNPDMLAKPSGFAHGIVVKGGRTLYLAGQTGMDATGQYAVPADLVAQFRQALANIKTVIAAAGGQMTDIVKLTVYATDKGDYKAKLTPLGAVWREFFGRYYPATTFVDVKGLFDDDALVELDAIAVLE